MGRGILIALIAVALLGNAGAVVGQSVTLGSVETDVVVRTDGKADFFESMDWEVTGGQMHGFYFQGAAGGGLGAATRPVFNTPQCFADLPGNQRVGLSITDRGNGRYDVVLAGGRAFSGTAMYYLVYGGDLAGPGLIAWTRGRAPPTRR
jgi:hypothetical protein